MAFKVNLSACIYHKIMLYGINCIYSNIILIAQMVVNEVEDNFESNLTGRGGALKCQHLSLINVAEVLGSP